MRPISLIILLATVSALTCCAGPAGEDGKYRSDIDPCALVDGKAEQSVAMGLTESVHGSTPEFDSAAYEMTCRIGYNIGSKTPAAPKRTTRPSSRMIAIKVSVFSADDTKGAVERAAEDLHSELPARSEDITEASLRGYLFSAGNQDPEATSYSVAIQDSNLVLNVTLTGSDERDYAAIASQPLTIRAGVTELARNALSHLPPR